MAKTYTQIAASLEDRDLLRELSKREGLHGTDILSKALRRYAENKPVVDDEPVGLSELAVRLAALRSVVMKRMDELEDALVDANTAVFFLTRGIKTRQVQIQDAVQQNYAFIEYLADRDPETKAAFLALIKRNLEEPGKEERRRKAINALPLMPEDMERYNEWMESRGDKGDAS